MAADTEGRITETLSPPVEVPEHRREQLGLIVDALRSAVHVALTTHVNADGDGAGCEAALASWLSRQGKTVSITNPTRFPQLYRHLIENFSWIVDPGTVRTTSALMEADVLLVVDTGERSRIGRIASGLSGRTVLVIDHHLPADEPIPGTVIQDETACAAGELIYDLLVVAGEPRPWPLPIARAIYTAIVTDTGSFRFSNTSARTHSVVADLVAQGVEPEEVYRDVFASVPLGRMRLLERALGQLEHDPDYRITWCVIDRAAMDQTGTGNEDLDGIVDTIRTVRGTEVAILFRETADGSTKISLRSSGHANVNAIAREYGGGGHVKASGALVPRPLADVVPRVLESTRAALRESDPGFRIDRGTR